LWRGPTRNQDSLSLSLSLSLSGLAWTDVSARGKRTVPQEPLPPELGPLRGADPYRQCEVRQRQRQRQRQRSFLKDSAYMFALLFLLAQQRPVDSLIAAERAFAQMSLDKTTQEAFLSVLPEDGVLFRPGPVNARKLLLERPFAADMWLKWAPMLAYVAESGELGYTSGPFESGRRGEPPRGKGYFVSIWRKDDSGAWKLIVDLGINSPAAIPVDSAAAVLSRQTPIEAGSTGGRNAAETLAEADNHVDGFLSDGRGSTYAEMLSADVRVYRAGNEPFVGRTNASRWLAHPKGVTWKSERAAVARSGDLGYTIGSYDSKSDRGSYVRIWRSTPVGWKIVLDITSATPPQGSQSP
jgi:ketosteroid isomerase-like protein